MKPKQGERYTESDLREYGFDPSKFKSINGGREWKGPCPVHVSHDSLIISNGFWWCRKCNSGGMLKRKGEVLTDAERREQYRLSEEQRLKDERALQQERIAKIKSLNATKPWIKYHHNLLQRGDVLHELEQDGIDIECVKRFQLGFIPNFNYMLDRVQHVGTVITFPIMHNDKCVQIRCRIREIKQGDKYRPFLNGMGLSYMIADDWHYKWVVLVEGEKKAIVLWKHHIPAIGISGCWCFKDEWAPELRKKYRTIFIALDGDNDDVLKAEQRLSTLLKANIIHLGGKPDDLLNSRQLTPGQLIRELSMSIFK